MKFLCSNCKAKYQIADEKVAGRTLRMVCRQCKQEIVIRGDAPARASITAHAQQSQPIAPPPAPSPLAADFQRQMSGGVRPSLAPPPPPLLDAWHVAINEVPVGPMRREDIARRIASGAVGPESLAWREGLDDWLPVRQIPELAALLGTSMPAPSPFMPALPAQRADIAPMGGRAGAAPAFSLDDWSQPTTQLPQDHLQQALRSASIASAAPEREDRDRGGFRISGGGLFAICAFAFLMSMMTIIGARLLSRDDQQGPAQPPVAAVTQQPAQAPAPEPEPSEMVIDLDEVGVEGDTKKPASGGKTPAADKPTTNNKPKLTQAEIDMLKRMGVDTGAATIGTGTGTAPGRKSNVASGESLTSEQLSKVVKGGIKNLQRCYETAMRGGGSDDTIRLDVELTISPNGNVTNVKSGDGGLPGMKDCIVRTVKMWRFPSAGDSTTTKFPLVFQPGN